MLASCKRDAEDLPVEHPFARDFYAQGEWRDTLPAAFQPFDYTIGAQVEKPFSNTYTCRSETGYADGYKTIQANVYGVSTGNPLFFVQFSQPGSDAVWTNSELTDLLKPGRVFPITGAPGEVRVGFEIPWFVHTYFLSQSGDAPQPGGSVEIVSAEAYSWEQINVLGQLTKHTGIKVRLRFQAKLGRLRPVNGYPKVVGEAALQNGEASLYFEYPE